MRVFALALLAALWIRQIHFERYMEKRARLLEIGIAENLGGLY